MPIIKIVLAVQAQLLREMLARVFARLEDFIIVNQLENLEQLSTVIKKTEIDWVLTSTIHDQTKQSCIDDFIQTHPTVCFVDIAVDRDNVTFNWLNNHDVSFSNLSLKEFIGILKERCICRSPK
jgi:DNA-binding NarL/FixJ family response regulator